MSTKTDRDRRRAIGLSGRTAHERAWRKSHRLKQRIEKTRLAREMKLASGCADCGYAKHHSALEFDHLPGRIKDLAIAEMLRKNLSWPRILAEIGKCEVVCANCHRVRTASRSESSGGRAFFARMVQAWHC